MGCASRLAVFSVLAMVVLLPIVAFDARSAEVEPSWQQVLNWAETGAECAGDSTELESAQELLRAHRLELDPYLEHPLGSPLPVRELTKVPVEARRAVEMLLRWRDADGGFSPGFLGRRSDPLSLNTLAKWVVATESDPAVGSHLESALMLGRALRRCGTMLHHLIGLTIADCTLRAAMDREAGIDDSLRRHRPRPEDSFHAMARGAVASYEMFDEVLRQAPADPSDNPYPEIAPERLEAELALLRSYYAERLEAASQDPADLEQQKRVWTAPLSSEHEASFLVDLAKFDPTRTFDSAAIVIVDYDEHLGTAGP